MNVTPASTSRSSTSRSVLGCLACCAPSACSHCQALSIEQVPKKSVHHQFLLCAQAPWLDVRGHRTTFLSCCVQVSQHLSWTWLWVRALKSNQTFCKFGRPVETSQMVFYVIEVYLMSDDHGTLCIGRAWCRGRGGRRGWGACLCKLQQVVDCCGILPQLAKVSSQFAAINGKSLPFFWQKVSARC